MPGINIVGPALVLKKFQLNNVPENGVLVEIVGRQPGIISFFLTRLGFDAETRLRVTNGAVSFKSSTLFGQVNIVAPITCISSTVCGYSKSVLLAVLGLLSIIGGFASIFNEDTKFLLFVGLVIGAGFLVAYWLSKKLLISVQTVGGIDLGLTFKGSVVENVAVDIAKAQEVIDVINRRVVNANFRQEDPTDAVPLQGATR